MSILWVVLQVLNWWWMLFKFRDWRLRKILGQIWFFSIDFPCVRLLLEWVLLSSFILCFCIAVVCSLQLEYTLLSVRIFSFFLDFRSFSFNDFTHFRTELLFLARLNRIFFMRRISQDDIKFRTCACSKMATLANLEITKPFNFSC